MIRRTIIAFLLTSTLVAASPFPFGLKIGETSYLGAKKRFQNITFIGESLVKEHKTYLVECDESDFEGLSSLTLVFDKKDTLVSIQGSIHKKRFSDIKKTLSKKYKLTADKTESDGTQTVSFEHVGDYPHYLNIVLTFSPFVENLDLFYAKESFHKYYKKQLYEKSYALL